MPTSPSVSDSTSQTSQRDLRKRVSVAFEQLVASAAELNAASDELAEPISSIDEALRKLNLGVSAWIRFRSISYDIENRYEYSESSYLGYAKVSQQWGLAIRSEATIDGLPQEEEEVWRFSDAPRAYRLEAMEKLPELLDKLAETSGKTAARLRKTITLTKQVAETINRMAPSRPARRK